MGRTRTFDETDAGAPRLEASGITTRGDMIPDLEKATGLSRSSIYHSFGSKRGLFDAAVDTYLDQIVRPRLLPAGRARGIRRPRRVPARLARGDGRPPHLSGGARMPAAQHRDLARRLGDALGEVVRDYRRELADAVSRRRGRPTRSRRRPGDDSRDLLHRPRGRRDDPRASTPKGRSPCSTTLALLGEERALVILKTAHPARRAGGLRGYGHGRREIRMNDTTPISACLWRRCPSTTRSTI
ncbi:MAG: helix-turn-helix domain-containing protein [Microbacterium sp.]